MSWFAIVFEIDYNVGFHSIYSDFVPDFKLNFEVKIFPNFQYFLLNLSKVTPTEGYRGHFVRMNN